MRFSASDAAFEGFRVVRRRPLSVLFWSLIYVVALVVGALVIGKPILTLMQQIEAVQSAGEPSMEDLQRIGQGYGLVFGVIGPLSIILSTMLSTAVSRAVVRPRENAFGYLRLGIDELRVFGFMVVIFLLVIVYYLVAAGICVGLGVYAHSSGQAWAWVLCVLAGIAAFLGLIWLSVRLCLAVPIIVAEKRFSLFDSFRLTKGRFWPLLGMALLAMVMTVVVAMLGGIIAMPFRFMLMGPMMSIQDPSQLLSMLQTHLFAVVGWGVINAIVSALQMVVAYAPFSAAYLALKGETGAA